VSPSKRFKPVQRVAESREKRAAQEFGDSQRRQHAQEARLQELKNYHKEYLERFQSAAKNGISAPQLMEYRAFLSKLETAIREQEKVVMASQHECSRSKAQWQEKHMRTQVLGKVVERAENAEKRTQQGREQKEQDEFSQRKGS
jgi:flagellar FliJ protein